MSISLLETLNTKPLLRYSFFEYLRKVFKINENGLQDANFHEVSATDGYHPSFVADHPFLFFITFKEILLFVGQFNG